MFHLIYVLHRFEDKEVQRDMKLVPYKIVNKDGKPYIQVKIKDGETKVFSPEEISAMILTKMKETAEAFLGKKVKDAVVTVPGTFIFFDLIVMITIPALCNGAKRSSHQSSLMFQRTSMMLRGKQLRMRV